MSSKQVHSNYRLLYNYVQSFPHFLWKLLRQKLVICLHSEDSYNGGGGGIFNSFSSREFSCIVSYRAARVPNVCSIRVNHPPGFDPVGGNPEGND